MSGIGTPVKRCIGERQIARVSKARTEATFAGVEGNINNIFDMEIPSSPPSAHDTASSPGEPTCSIVNEELEDEADDVTHVYHCNDMFGSNNSEEYPSEGENDEIEEDFEESLVFKLRLWALKNNITGTALKELLGILHPLHPELPCDPRTMRRTPRYTVVRDLTNGGYSHVGLKIGLERRYDCGGVRLVCDSKSLKVDINIDGISLFKSSVSDVWPILGRCKNLVDSRPFVIGIFCGSGKPEPVGDYLQDYIDEVKSLREIVLGEETYSVVINSYLCDAPARAYVKCIKSHAGYHACEKCVQEGEYEEHRVCFSTSVSQLRTDDSFRAPDEDESLHHIGVSPLAELGTKFVTEFPLDPMHLILEGNMKRFLQFLMKDSKSTARLSAHNITCLSQRQEDLYHMIPQEFSRKPRSFTHFTKWKATEMRLFLLYTGPVVLKGILSDAMYHTFLLLHVAMVILSRENFIEDEDYLSFAQELIEKYVQQCAHKDVFGKKYVVYNVHSLLHIVEDVRRFGTLMNFSVFPFENFLGQLKRMVRSPTLPLQQLTRRLAEWDYLYDMFEVPSTGFSTSGNIPGTNEYRTLQCPHFVLSSCHQKDSYFSLKGRLAFVKKILEKDGEVRIVADVCDEAEDFFHYPCESSSLGIFNCGPLDWTRHDVEISCNEIDHKYVVLPCGKDSIAFPLLHT